MMKILKFVHREKAKDIFVYAGEIMILLLINAPVRFSDEPDAPGKPQITDWDKDHVDLQWPVPKNDGGSPITGYIVQKKEKGSPYWVNAVHVPAGQNSTTVPDLTEGQDYEFRVIAVNAAGQSEPSEPSDLVTAKPRYRKS